MASRKRRRAILYGIPALVAAGLTFVALWRVTAPEPTPAGAAPEPRPAPLPPLTEVGDVLAGASIGRRAALDGVPILEVPSARTLWLDAGDRRVLAVLDPDVKRSHEARIVAGARVTLIGLVRPAPRADVAVRQWSVDAATARVVEQAGTYLYVTEVRPAS